MSLTAPEGLASRFPAIVHIYTDVLRVLANAPTPMTATQLATATGRDKSNVRRDLRKLEEAGVVTLDSEGAFITDEGVAWVRGQAIAEGLATPGEIIRVPDRPLIQAAAGHANFRRNPDQPRKDFDDAVIRGIADTMAADAESGGKGILQPLLVRPRDPTDPLDGDEANPVRMIWAGEQRWRAIGLLIAEGRLPAALDPARGGGIPFEERAEPPGGAAFLALVENGARSDLDPLDEAFAFLDYVTRENLSARQAAINTGRAAKGEGGVRTVQIRIKVAKEATPEAIAEYRRTKDWNALVDSVQKSHDGGPPPYNPARSTPEEHRAWCIAKNQAALPDLSPKALLVLVEMADKIIRDPAKNEPGYTETGETYPDYTKTLQKLIETVGCGGSHKGGRSFYKIGEGVADWLAEQGYLLADGAPADVLHRLRLAGAGAAPADRAAATGKYWTPWLNGPVQQVADPEEPTMFDPPPAKPAASLWDLLPGRSVIALAEILHLSPEAADDAFLPQAQAGKYWLDANLSTMKDAGLVVIVHEIGKPPFIRITDMGLGVYAAALTSLGVEFRAQDMRPSPDELQHIRGARGQASWPGPGMVTPWLNIEGTSGIEVVCPVADISEDRIEIDVSLPGDEAEDERSVVDILGPDVLREIVFAGDPGEAGRAFLSGLFDRVGFKGPFLASQSELAEGLIHDAVGRCVLTCDVEGDETAAMAHAQAIVVAAALNAALGLTVDLTPQASAEAAE